MRSKSELGNLVAANMASIMDSEEHRMLFRKQADHECHCAHDCDCDGCGPGCKHKEESSDAADAADGGKCECPEGCKCKKSGECKGLCECKKDKDDAADVAYAADGGKKKCKCPSGCEDCTKDEKCECKCVEKKEAKGANTCECPPDCKKCTKDEKCKCKCVKKAALKCKCPCDKCKNPDKCPGKGKGCPCAKKEETKAMFGGLFESVLKMSETLDELGLEKSASDMIRVADALLVEAAGADTIEEMMRENPDLDIDVAVVKEEPREEEEGELFDPRLMALEFEEEAGEGGDLEAQLKAIEEGEAEGKSPAELAQELGLAEPEVAGRDYPGSTGWGEAMREAEGEEAEADDGALEELEAANTEVDTWLKKHASKKGDEIELDADLSSLLITAEKEVEDYLIDKNLSFEDEG